MVIKYVTRGLSIIWLAWWLYSSFIVFLPDAILTNIREVFSCVIFALSVYIAWRWDVVGGVWFLFVGIIAPFYFKISSSDTTTFIFLSTVAPLFLGILFLISWRLDEKSRVKHYSHTQGISK